MSSSTYEARPRTRLQKRGNPNWGKPCQPILDRGTLFDELVEKAGLTGKPELWEFSRRLKAFAQKNRGSRYVPEWLLKVWGMDVDESEVNVYRGLSA